MWLLLLACADPPEGTGTSRPLIAAQLEAVELVTWFLVGGVAYGEADLVITDDKEQAHVSPVSLDGVVIGGVVDASWTGGAAAPLFLPDDEVMAADLFTLYSGVVTSVSGGVGISTHHLESERGVQLDVALFEAGIGVRVAFESLGITQLEPFEAVDE